jgi:hypothetical protein
MSIKYNRNKQRSTINLQRDDTTVNQNSTWSRYTPNKISSGRIDNLFNQRFSSNSNTNSNRVLQRGGGPVGGPTGCGTIFTEGCDGTGYNTLIMEWDPISMFNLEVSINNAMWTNIGCGTQSPLINTTLTKGDNVRVRGVCNVDIQYDPQADCGTTEIASDTNIYVFYDVTSMQFSAAQDFRDAIEDWANNNIANYTGNVYHLPVMHERWISWVQYPLTGELPPYYHMSKFSAVDEQQHQTLWQPSQSWFVAPGNPGPKDLGGNIQRIPWEGPLVTSLGIHTYNNSLPDDQGNAGGGAQTLQSTGLPISMTSYQRGFWHYASDGTTPFFNLPKAGDKIPNFNGSGTPHYLTLADAADLTDVKSGEYNNNGGNPTVGQKGELDAGGSRARFCGGDVDALVICLSDETVHQNGWEFKHNSHTMSEASLAGAWEGYHGVIYTGQYDRIVNEISNLTNTYNDSTAIAEAKSHYFVYFRDSGQRFTSYSSGNTDKCYWTNNPSKPYDITNGSNYTSDDDQDRWTAMAYDWNRNIAGIFIVKAQSYPKYMASRNFRNYGDTYFPTNGWYDQWDTTNLDVDVICGCNHCPSASNGWESAGCNFDILSQPTPGYISDFKYYLDNVYPIIEAADAASSDGCKFSTFFYVVTNNVTSASRNGNPLTTVAALEGRTLGSYQSGATDAAGNVINFTGLPDVPSTATTTISVQALGYFNPYGYEDQGGNPIYWHPNETYGFDIKNHQYFKPTTSDNVPGYGFKHYAKGYSGRCGYNVKRSTATTQQIADDLNDFISGGGTQCGGQDCLTIIVNDSTGNPLPGYSFDFNGTTITADQGSGGNEWGTQVNPGVFAFLCGHHYINTSPQNYNGPTPDHTDLTIASSTSGQYGCNAWRIVLTIEEFDITLQENCTLGCTDGTGVNNPVGSSAACNYDINAGVDDGSCIYSDCSDMCPDTSITPYSPYPGLGSYPNAPSQVFPYAFQPGGGDAYYSPQCPDCCVGGNTGVLPSDCVDCLGVCGGTATYDECGVCDGPGEDECGVCFGDGTSCVGCMDEMAINYDPNATIPCEDCCEFIDIECKIREVSRLVLESCPKDCDEYYKNLLLEVTMLYSGLLMVSENCGMTAREVNAIVTSIHRLLVKVECGMCKNC